MYRAGSAHLFQTLFERRPSTMKSDIDIVQRGTETNRQTVAWLSQYVGSPDDFGVFGFEGWQEPMHAVAYCCIQFRVRSRCDVPNVDLIAIDLPSFSPGCCPLMINQGGCKDTSQPSAHRLDITQLIYAFECAQGKTLQDFLRLASVPQALLQKRQHFLPGLDQRPAYRSIIGFSAIIGAIFIRIRRTLYGGLCHIHIFPQSLPVQNGPPLGQRFSCQALTYAERPIGPRNGICCIHSWLGQCANGVDSFRNDDCLIIDHVGIE